MEKRYAHRAQKIRGSVIREILKLTAEPGVISFAGGLPSAESFPYEQMKLCTQKALESDPVAMLQYGQSEGYAPLRETLAGRLGVKCEQLLVTTGAQQGIDLACKSFLNKGDVILTENPTFLGALNTFKMYDAHIVPVETDENGIVISDLEAKIKEFSPKLLYVIPTFQNPTGVTTSLGVRREISELASQHNVMILEDDPYAQLRYSGEALPSIYHLNKTGHVILLNTFSKTIAPGLRVGFALGEPEVIAKMTVGKQSTDVHSTMLSQGIINEYLKSGEYQPHLQEVCQMYRLRRDRMLACMQSCLPPEVTYNRPEGGLFVWCTLPEYMDSSEIFREALKQKVAFVSGNSFFVENPEQDNHLRLNFSNSSPEQIQAGIEALGQVIQRYLQ